MIQEAAACGLGLYLTMISAVSALVAMYHDELNVKLQKEATNSILTVLALLRIALVRIDP